MTERSARPTGIVHLLAGAPARLFDFLERELPLPAEEARRLVALGAVYLRGRRAENDTPISAGDYVRVHTRPRRFPTAAIEWRETVIVESDEYLVVDKPALVPVHATLDNARENLVDCLGRAR